MMMALKIREKEVKLFVIMVMSMLLTVDYSPRYLGFNFQSIIIQAMAVAVHIPLQLSFFNEQFVFLQVDCNNNHV